MKTIKLPPFINSTVPLKLIRQRAKLTQGQMANELKCHVQFVSNWERGLCLPPAHVMKKLYRNMKPKEQKYFERCVSADLFTSYMKKIK